MRSLAKSLLDAGVASLLLGGLAACGNDDPYQVLSPQLQQVPPPLSGGALLVTRDDATVIAADADRNMLWLVDTASQTLRTRVQLSMDSEPGRLIETQDNTIYVALRRSGVLAKLDAARGKLINQIKVCAAPRGLVHRAADDTIHIVCASGELVTIDAKTDQTVRSWSIDSDLRDIVLWGDHFLISRFRSAEILEVSATGAVMSRIKPRSAVTTTTDALGSNPKTHRSSPTNAWRMVALPSGDALVLHQRALDDAIPTAMDAYRDGLCNASGMVTAALMLISGNGSPPTDSPGPTIAAHPLTLDVAVSNDGQKFALIEHSDFRAESPMFTLPPPHRPIWTVSRSAVPTTPSCLYPSESTAQRPWGDLALSGAYDKKNQLWIQTLSGELVRATDMTPKKLPIDGLMPVEHVGRKLFHTPTRAGIACVSCHPEARDDTHRWNFAGLGIRRTQSLHRDLQKTAPFHWDGELADLQAFSAEIFTKRMSGAALLTAEQLESLGTWLDNQPRFPRAAPADAAAIARGEQLFSDPTVGCSTCHGGPQFTNNQTVDVGTGKAFQVPSLIDVVARAPYMHDGCAATLEARFSSVCGGGDRHGKTSQLSAAQLSDLAAYLRTL